MTIDGQGSLFPHPNGEQEPLPEPKPEPELDSSILDDPQVFEEASSFQVRAELEKLIRLDLLGPWGGETEELPPRSAGPSERYLVGRLGPKMRAGSVADSVPNLDSSVQGDPSEADLPEVIAPQTLGKIWASSMGLTFSLPLDVEKLHVVAEWGRYEKAESESEDGKRRSVWRRTSVTYPQDVLINGLSKRIPLTVPDSALPGVHLDVEPRAHRGTRVVRLTLVNTQDEPSSNADTAWLFQPALAVTALDGGSPMFLPIGDPLDSEDELDGDREDAHLRLLYRQQRRYASGHNVAVHPTVDEGQRRARMLETTWLPAFDVAATVADTSRLPGVLLSMDELALVELEELRAGLLPLADGYAAWLDERASEVESLPAQLRAAADSAVFTARGAAKRVRAGITLLTDSSQSGHAQAIAAFRFANRAMASQRRHTEVSRIREDRGLSYADALAEVKTEGPKVASWRPFQLAFVLLNLPSLTEPAHAERTADHTGLVDLLFFPTGGGKTEAYLGLTAFTFAMRRLQGVVGSGLSARDGRAGVAVLMRYTLRLLTAQQFQRAAALVCAAEVERRTDEATWGSEPFRIGLWVGGGVSPNWYTDAAAQIAEAREAGHAQHTNVLQTLNCPWCATKLRAQHDLDPRDDLHRVLLWCPNSACPFSRTQCDEGLPILTVDEEIYRYAPSLVIATVDKLAQLPWRGFAGILFGRVRLRCPRHGYRHDDLDSRAGCAGRHNAKGRLPAVTSEAVIRLRPPDLIIQDELHLISGALGTMVGLFEAAVDELCAWEVLGSKLTGPKIVASTATTKRAREQVLSVFGRELAVFPPPVLDIEDTFFSRQVPVTPETPGRRYLGVCAHGVRLKQAEIRLAEILLLAGQTLFDRYGAPADPYMTTVSYFNATRELAGMRRYLDDDVATRVRSHGRRKGLADRLTTGMQLLISQELTSRISSADISEVLRRLEYGFDPELDTTVRKAAIANAIRSFYKRGSGARSELHPLADRYYQRQNDERTPVDVVLATSMLQVGVDVSRFGLMVVTGQPKNTAEYIQASSRVGRTAFRPGLVVTLANWSRPRDLAHFEDFEYYHATFYRQVEALSVTPYTRRALDRGTTAMFVAAVRQAEESFSRNADAHDVPLDSPRVNAMVARMLARAAAIAGDRGRDYLQERLRTVMDRWNLAKTGPARLGYRQESQRQQQLIGLLTVADGTRWTDQTVGMSMRETENEINLLLPGGGEIFNPLFGVPAWTFAPPTTSSDDGGDVPEGDEMGDSTLTEGPTR